MVSVNPARNILTCALQNMDDEEIVAVKIIQTYMYTTVYTGGGGTEKGGGRNGPNKVGRREK